MVSVETRSGTTAPVTFARWLPKPTPKNLVTLLITLILVVGEWTYGVVGGYEKLALTRALRLPTMLVAGLTLIRRLALIIDDGRIGKVFYPVFPPDRNAGDVLVWLRQNKRP